jgi:hypothetical protein
LDFLIEKIWKSKIKKFIDNGSLHIIWDRNKIGNDFKKDSSNYYLSNNVNAFTWNHLEIEKLYSIYSEEEKIIKLTLNPFDKNNFSWYRPDEGPYPLLSIFDNSLFPEDIGLHVINNSSESYPYIPKIKYTIQPYIISTPYDEKVKTKKSYVIIPSYEVDIKVPKWKSKIVIVYEKYITTEPSGIRLIINESY